MDYKDTIHLFDTDFPMRGDLAKREPLMLKAWLEQNQYIKLRNKCANRPKFILHDGPPYANGDIHLGHAVNKILKDIIIRYKTLSGFDVNFIPTWDCHGLPIELNVEKIYGRGLSNKEFRQKCREYAKTQIDKQQQDFKRLGILANWEHAYTTMDFKVEAATIRALGIIYQNGYLVKGAKPVHWCIDCKSALAEAEVEYIDKDSSAVYVKFALNDSSYAQLIKAFNIDNNQLKLELQANKCNIFAVIWTTTPWTLPSNEAICVGGNIEYQLIKYNNDYLILAKDMASNVYAKLIQSTQLSKPADNNNRIIDKTNNQINMTILANALGGNLEGILFNHPLYLKSVPCILGAHVTTDSGTGLVHTAPAHGVDDYNIGLNYNLPISTKVLANGLFDNDSLLGNISIWQANKKIIELLEQNNYLLLSETIKHSYPHCWRHKSPLIFIATKQWFIALDDNGRNDNTLREITKNAIDGVKFYPASGKTRLYNMINNRPNWCVSRQRSWCTPMVFFEHKVTGELHPDSMIIINQVASLVEKHGIDIWLDEITAHDLKINDADNYIKVLHTLDVWFDSGVTHYSVLGNDNELSAPADLYLEGSDQHRGWFQSSILTSCAMSGKAPYKNILTHGFTVDAKGYKMSKSLGNTVSPNTIINKYGVDILRLWVASVDYTNELSYSDEVMQGISHSYRRIRNTIRFLLTNLVDFEAKNELLDEKQLCNLDRYILILLDEFQTKSINYYNNYQFHFFMQEVITFCTDTLGGFYLDTIKDRLYTTQKTGLLRKAAQTTIYHIANSLILLLAPVLCFTMDEGWNSLHGISPLNKNSSHKHTNECSHNHYSHEEKQNECEHDALVYHELYDIPVIANASNIKYTWEHIIKVRSLLLLELENSRVAGLIGSSLQADVNICINSKNIIYLTLINFIDELKFIFMVAKVIISSDDGLNIDCDDKNSYIKIIINKSQAQKCVRCWHYTDDVGNDAVHSTICNRCITNLSLN